ncbi:ankyrin repeat domain-containing protein [Winogradskyella sp. A2]|uniref:ankyrin repeat domain-containing protein n=1 Tax=Winogradskyella sp. A2 TaxID=3366944 RepID=UPI00398C2948
MTKIKINSLRTIVNFSLAILLLSTSCKNSTQNSEVTAANEVTSVSSAKVPDIDIQLAILSNNIEEVKQHIDAGTDLNKKDAMSGSTPLITASSFGKKEITKLLVDAGADLSLKNNDGATALHTAAFFCRVDILNTLLEAGADKTLRNNFGATPRETVMGPFEQIKPIYEMLQQQLQPMGMEFDLGHIQNTRPIIAEMLK